MGLVCSVRNFSCFVAPCQHVVGQSPFENLPKYFCCDGLSVSSTRLLSPTLFVLPIVSTSLHWNFFASIQVVKCFTNCSKIFSWKTVLQNERTHTHARACVRVRACMCVEGARITDHRITEHSVANPTKLKKQHSEIVLHDRTNVRRVHRREGRAVSYISRIIVRPLCAIVCGEPDSAVGVVSPLQLGPRQCVSSRQELTWPAIQWVPGALPHG
jgi:hypothetical protein